ncbi:alpha/beta fold hydrolase [Cellulomonas shaoxiangyii]|uniref:Alpha/beta hydrolase n=1 Tax=Cellulomonas shaoxiangyii TaxID=2566013 RepID=A0A4P7SFB8_9CELL|nr:alpha/beta hydrolase [Cellulomonas shaoxiangyii]QCB92221.1 alpha/beta hydrolase [Cellulomonas shaoxiangyii]TGY82623.1 alpha/beta hydrolase [Cellulomonas shaoxiangyii]
MTATATTDVRTLDVPGARLTYEVRGAGPVLVLVGSPMGADAFAAAADLLADARTVVTLDPRGTGRSTVDDPAQDSTPELRADDVAAVLDALGARTADVLGSSGGAVTALALAQGHPGRVGTLVAHEPPLLDLLPDAAAHHARTALVVETFRAHGAAAAWGAFMGAAGWDDDAAGPPATGDDEQLEREGARFFLHELTWTTTWVPDVAAVRAGAGRVVVGLGVDSGALETAATSAALADRLGVPLTAFPGEHTGFLEQPEAFTDRLRAVLASD